MATASEEGYGWAILCACTARRLARFPRWKATLDIVGWVYTTSAISVSPETEAVFAGTESNWRIACPWTLQRWNVNADSARTARDLSADNQAADAAGRGRPEAARRAGLEDE